MDLSFHRFLKSGLAPERYHMASISMSIHGSTNSWNDQEKQNASKEYNMTSDENKKNVREAEWLMI